MTNFSSMTENNIITQTLQFTTVNDIQQQNLDFTKALDLETELFCIILRMMWLEFVVGGLIDLGF